MSTLYLLSVWAHILAAAVWIGSMAFFALAIVPVLRQGHNRELMLPMVQAIGRRFRVIGWACLVVLVVTGLTNLWLRGIGASALMEASFWASAFGRTLAHKLALVGVVFVATAAHDALSGSPRRKLISWLGRVTLLLSMGVVILAVALVRGVPW